MVGMYNTYYDVSKCTLWGIKGDNDQFSPRLVLSFRDGNPRFVVYTGEKGVIINFPCDVFIMQTVLDRMKEIVDAPPGTKIGVNSKSVHYDNGKRTNEKRLVSTLYVGKNKDGIIYIYIREDKKPDIIFAFRKNEWHDFFDANKVELPEDVMSRYFANAYIKFIENSLALFIHQYTLEAYQKGEYKPGVIENGRQPAKGQGTMKGYASKGAEKAMAKFDEFDEDIPM